MGKHRRYRVGIDVGLYSVGLAAIEIDDSSDNPYEAMPLDFLSIMSVIHDGAIDPSAQKSADSRKKVSGVARRTRNLFKRRRKRLSKLDELLAEFEYPVAQASEMVANMHDEDPYLPWRARISLVGGYIENETKRKLALAVAVRHIARHRGWRNPYSGISSLKEQAPIASSFYMELFGKLQRWLFENGRDLFPGVIAHEDDKGDVALEGIPHWNEEGTDVLRPTVAQLLEPLLAPEQICRFRKEPPKNTDKNKDENDPEESAKRQYVHAGKLHQSDNYYELLRIFETQRVPRNEQEAIIKAVFDQINPKDVGAAANLVAKDDLQKTKYRASKASLAFQRYRILTTLANLRIREGKDKRPLTDDERRCAYDYLSSEEASALGPELTWHHLAEQLNTDRNSLAGVGGQTADGSPISAKQPPYISTEHAILSAGKKHKQLKPLVQWWEDADDLSKEYLIEFLGNAGTPNSGLNVEEQRAKAHVEEFLAELGKADEEALAKLDKINLPAGRAAYSVDTLSRLNKRMLEEGLDLFEARKAEFGVENDWRPKANPLGSPTGNPAVDRTIKIVARWLKACEREWGAPETVFVEHVREGFKTEKQKREDQKDKDKRYNANKKVREAIVDALGEKPGSGITGVDAIKHADIRRWQAVQRQNNQCLYCGMPINFENAQMDHIVPRKGVGCSNELPNLVAVCADCNESKDKRLFSSWAGSQKLEETIERVRLWTQDSYFSSGKQFTSFKNDVISRLKQKEEDDSIDVRSVESVAWMARELREQIAGHFHYEGVVQRASEGNDPFSLQRVQVYKGWITSEARKASGLENNLPWLGSYSEKTRLDRRHHAVDAAVIAFMRPAVAKTLIERDSLHREALDTRKQFEKGSDGDWRMHRGATAKESEIFLFWRDAQMRRLNEILASAMENHRIVVCNPLRLGLGVGKAHKDEIRPLLKRKVRDSLSAAAIDKAESPALWAALTRDPDYDPVEGLPVNTNRSIRVHNRLLKPTDEIGFMATEEDFDKVKQGAANIRVRNGYAGAGDTMHHVRLYRVPKANSKGKQTGWQYAALRVFQADLVGHGRDDLFSVSLPLQSISVRAALPCLRNALKEGNAEYLGWMVVGDEVLVDPHAGLFRPDGSQKINKFMRAFPGTRRFSIIGFNTNSKITLAPREFAAEGIPNIDWASGQAEKTIGRIYGEHGWNEQDIELVNLVVEKGCPLSIDKVFSTHPVIVRRNTLGIPRWKSNNNMPVSWKVPPHPVS